MPSSSSAKSPDVVQAYLAYLKEMSRKISQRTGMENVLYGKTKASPHYYRALGAKDDQYWRAVANHLAKTSDRQLFLGNGLVVGCLWKKQTRKHIAAPLLYALVRVEPDEAGRVYTYAVEWDSVSLNYDLVTLVLEQDLDEEEDNEFFDHSAGIDTQQLNILEDVETGLQKLVDSQPEQVMTDPPVTALFKTLQTSMSELSGVDVIDPSRETFTLDRLQKKSMDIGLRFYPQQFFYVANLPGQLSTYTALRKLIAEVS